LPEAAIRLNLQGLSGIFRVTLAASKKRRILPRLVIGAAVLYALGFLAFFATLPRPISENEIDGADGIVALTGEGGRLAPAVALLEQHKGKRLLISGVNPLTTKEQLKTLLRAGPDFDCCADLDFAAADTYGNAIEAAKWASSHQYKSLIVVTANYHMPRSMLEFGAAMKDTRLVAYPVTSDTQRDLWREFPRLQSEYAKYLASLLRVSLLEANRKT
jgi:uncharacterized SAM-binding protein YcdF (DUF218 family)